tara:strand:- start:575 stop:1231 length:657 start_codon:yes stop_codon:yes gene_type:complete
MGADTVTAAIESGLVPVELFVALREEGEKPLGTIDPDMLRLSFPGSLEVESGLLAKVTGMVHAPNVIGIFRRADLPRAGSSEPCERNIALWRVADPGNVGTILRSADALGPCAVFLSRGCGDPTGPKAVRAAAGALTRVPLGNFDEAPRPWFALVPQAGDVLRAGIGRGTFVCGAERAGLPPDVLARCDRVVRIPTEVGAESLNVSIAAAIALHVSRG